MTRTRWLACTLLGAALIGGCGGAADKQAESGTGSPAPSSSPSSAVSVSTATISPLATTPSPTGTSVATVAATPSPAATATATATGTSSAVAAATTATATPTTAPSPAATAAASPTAAATTPGAIDWTRLEKLGPTDRELPDRVAYATKIDLSNEQAANNAQELQAFRQAGRLSGIQFIYSVEAGARSVSVGISYYNNAGEPAKLLRTSGDPANASGPNRFTVPGLGDAYIAQRLQLGSGEAVTSVINIAFVRGTYFVGIADLGGTADTATDIAAQIARAIDSKLAANPVP